MTTEPITVRADATASAAAALMRDHDLGSLPVIDEGKLVGFLTDRDIVIRCVAKKGDCSATPVGGIMSPEIFSCNQDQSPQEVMELMSTRQVRRLPVVNDDEHLVGIVNIAKLAEASGEPQAVCDTITAVRDTADAS